MSLEQLANELLFDIFEYLSCVDLFHTFGQLNSRFNSLLIEYFRNRKYFDFRLIFKEDLNLIRRRYLPLFINDIESICLSDDDKTPHEIDVFISRLYPLHRFENLKSIILFNIYSLEKINRVLKDLEQISCLANLNLKKCYIKYDPKNILNMMNSIWSLTNLNHCYLDLHFDDICHLIPPTIISCSIKNLSISGVQCDLDNLRHLYDHTPFIEYLSINLWDPYDDHFQLCLMPTINVLKLKCETSSRIIQALLRKTPNLKNLTVETKKIYMNGHMWKEILCKNLLSLKIFNLKMEFQFSNDNSNNIEQQIDQLIDSFRTEYWIDQNKWFIRCFYDTINENNLITLHTLPYRFEHISININDNFLCTSTCSKDEYYFKYSYVKYLTYSCLTTESINSPDIKFSNIAYLTLMFPYANHFKNMIRRLDKLKSLEILINDWDNYDNDLAQLQILLDQSPNLFYLRFHSWPSGISTIENKNRKTSNSIVWKMPPFSNHSSSVRYLDLRGYSSSGHSQYYNDQQCSALIRSPLGSQCEFLIIEVEKRTNIMDLINKMTHLRTLNVRCRDKRNDNELMKWLQVRLPSTCSFAKDARFPNDIRLWIR